MVFQSPWCNRPAVYRTLRVELAPSSGTVSGTTSSDAYIRFTVSTSAWRLLQDFNLASMLMRSEGLSSDIGPAFSTSNESEVIPNNHVSRMP